MNTVTITMAFLMGLTGSLHCAGMCGPIIWVMPFHFLTGIKKWVGILLYHIGRISTYAAMATILHSFRSLFQPQVQQYISIVLGSMLLIAGIVSLVPSHRFKFSLPWADVVKKKLGALIGKPGVGVLFMTGVLNGLLPCGLVYMALSASITTPSTSQAMVFMYSFGLGTMPMLISLTILKKKITFFKTDQLRKLVPVMMFCFGCLFMLRGLNLGIPYLSPKVAITEHGIKACCCHKK